MLVPILIALIIFLGLLAYYQFYIAPKLNPVNKAESLEEQNMPREAIIEYKKALDRDPKDFTVHNRLANIYLRLKEFDQAAIHLEEIIRIDKYNYEVEKLDIQKKLTQVYFNRDDIERAFQTYLDILKQFPGDVESLYNVAFIALGQEEFDIAERYFERLTKLKPDDFDIQFGAGICSYQNQKVSNAIEHFIRALTVKPNSEVANLSIAFAFYRKRDYKQAIIHLNKVSETVLEPVVTFIAKRLNAFSNILSKKYDIGIGLFEEMLEIARKNDMEEELLLTLYDIGFACVSAERTNHAYDYWNELYQMNRNYKGVDGLVTMLRKEMDMDYKSIKETFEVSVSDYLEDWASEAFPPGFLWGICGLKSDRKIDLKNIMVTTRIPTGRESPGAEPLQGDMGEHIERYCSLDSETFRILSGRLVEKLGYKVDQILTTYRETDGVDFLATSMEDKERVLIWIRRWTKTKVGEIPLRNFAQSINDIKAKRGLFITTAELTTAAEASLRSLSKVTVIYPAQTGELLSGLL